MGIPLAGRACFRWRVLVGRISRALAIEAHHSWQKRKVTTSFFTGSRSVQDDGDSDMVFVVMMNIGGEERRQGEARRLEVDGSASLKRLGAKLV